MSAFGPKRTSLVALHMSALGGKADMTVCGCPLSRSLLGVKQTSLFAAHMSAFDPKRTFQQQILNRPLQSSANSCPSLTLPVGHAVPKKFGSVSPCYVLLHSLCRAHLTVLLAQCPARQFR